MADATSVTAAFKHWKRARAAVDAARRAGEDEADLAPLLHAEGRAQYAFVSAMQAAWPRRVSLHVEPGGEGFVRIQGRTPGEAERITAQLERLFGTSANADEDGFVMFPDF